MIPWWYLPLAVLGTFILTYSLHGTWRYLIGKVKAPLYKEFETVRADLQALESKIPAEIKAEWQKLIARIDKVLP